MNKSTFSEHSVEGSSLQPQAAVNDPTVYYLCERCVNCCKWPGQVKITESEIAQIAAHLGLSEYDFIQKHTRLRYDRRGLALLEKNNGECEWLDGNSCLLQPVKPQQCRDFPNRWNFPGWENFCQAIPIKLSGLKNLADI
ncbi:MAG: YkgJ family cysteine cluster protein [Chthoniobacterales bacterium]|nr:YkgJ family cysteine cluster protein [Chthoniobacterales bacterium]